MKGLKEQLNIHCEWQWASAKAEQAFSSAPNKE